MSIVEKSGLPRQPVTRREFIKGSAVAAALPALGVEAAGRDAGAQAPNKKPPNIIIIIADQFRWDALGAYGLNSMGLTPHLDSMARQGTLFRSHTGWFAMCDRCALPRAPTSLPGNIRTRTEFGETAWALLPER